MPLKYPAGYERFHHLLILLKLKTSYKGSFLAIKRLLNACLLESFTLFVKKLHRRPKRSSRGRRKIDHEAVFKYTVRQVMEGEANHLNALTYDPVIL